jgi:hypothetical protein
VENADPSVRERSQRVGGCAPWLGVRRKRLAPSELPSEQNAHICKASARRRLWANLAKATLDRPEALVIGEAPA